MFDFVFGVGGKPKAAHEIYLPVFAGHDRFEGINLGADQLVLLLVARARKAFKYCLVVTVSLVYPLLEAAASGLPPCVPNEIPNRFRQIFFSVVPG